MKYYSNYKIILLASFLSLISCANVKGPSPQFQQEVTTYVSPKDSFVQGMHESLYIEGERNAVLNFNRLGWLNLVYGDFDEAEWAFDQSLMRIETIYADDPQAEEAKSKFNEEDVKDFKGESYERAMAYYYRGILYLIKGDYENARASFKMGEFQDTVSTKEQYQSDFALLNYLQGWASRCTGNQALAEEAFAYALDYNQKLSLPEPDHQLLMLFDSGTSPLKAAVGEYKEILQFAQGTEGINTQPTFFVQFDHRAERPKIKINEVSIAVDADALTVEEVPENLASNQLFENVFFIDDGVPAEDYVGDETVIVIDATAEQSIQSTETTPPQFFNVEDSNGFELENIELIDEDDFHPTTKKVVASLDTTMAVDVYMQASTRGGRPVQGILDGKAQFKDTTKTIGKVSSAVGAASTVAGLVGGSDIAVVAGLGLQVVGALASAVSNATTPKADTRYWDTLPNTVHLSTFSKPEGDFLIKVGDKVKDDVDAGVYGNVLGGDDRCSVFWATSLNPDSVPKASPQARLSWQEMADKDDEVVKDDEYFRQRLSIH